MAASAAEITIRVRVHLSWWECLKMRLMGQQVARLIVEEHIKLLREKLIARGWREETLVENS